MPHDSIWDNSFAAFLAVMAAMTIIAGWVFTIIRVGMWFAKKYETYFD